MSNQVINPSTGMQEMVFSLNSEEDLHNALVEGDKYYRRQRIVPVKFRAQQLMAIAASFETGRSDNATCTLRFRWISINCDEWQSIRHKSSI